MFQFHQNETDQTCVCNLHLELNRACTESEQDILGMNTPHTNFHTSNQYY